jgi:hypothetical protein
MAHVRRKAQSLARIRANTHATKDAYSVAFIVIVLSVGWELVMSPAGTLVPRPSRISKRRATTDFRGCLRLARNQSGTKPRTCVREPLMRAHLYAGSGCVAPLGAGASSTIASCRSTNSERDCTASFSNRQRDAASNGSALLETLADGIIARIACSTILPKSVRRGFAAAALGTAAAAPGDAAVAAAATTPPDFERSNGRGCSFRFDCGAAVVVAAVAAAVPLPSDAGDCASSRRSADAASGPALPAATPATLGLPRAVIAALAMSRRNGTNESCGDRVPRSVGETRCGETRAGREVDVASALASARAAPSRSRTEDCGRAGATRDCRETDGATAATAGSSSLRVYVASAEREVGRPGPLLLRAAPERARRVWAGTGLGALPASPTATARTCVSKRALPVGIGPDPGSGEPGRGAGRTPRTLSTRLVQRAAPTPSNA